MITIRRDHQIGPLLRRLRTDAGLTVRQLAEQSRLSRSAISKREQSRAGYVGILVDHAQVLGFDVALVPSRHPGARPTGTGWPA